MSPRARILPPYTQRVDDTRHRIGRVLLFAGLILFAMLLGFLFAVLPLSGLFIPLLPIILLFLLALWLAPDVDPMLDRAIVGSLVFFFYVALLWPEYIAFNIAGLPWISFQRLAMFAVVLLTAYALATSSRMRGEVRDIFTSQPLMMWLLIGWVILQTLMLAVTGFKVASRWTHYMLVWNFLFFVSAWASSKPGVPLRLARVIIIASAVTGVLALLEVRNEAPIWVDNIPGFLGINPSLLDNLSARHDRGDGVYRARSIWVTSVNYAEFISVFVPFVLHAVFYPKSPLRMFFAIMLVILLLSVALLTNARTAMIGMLLGTVLTILLWTVRRFRTHAPERDLIAPAFLWLYPFAAATTAVAIMLHPRLREKFIGGGQHQGSTDARGAQWDMAIPRILNNPFGYGMDQVGVQVPYTNRGGFPTVDAYPINLLIEYGVLGFLIFVGIFFTAIFLAVRVYLRADDDEDELLAGPAAIAIFSFLIARIVLSAEGAQFYVFALAGMILALAWRQDQRLAALAPAPAPPPVPLYPLPPRSMPALASTSARR